MSTARPHCASFAGLPALWPAGWVSDGDRSGAFMDTGARLARLVSQLTEVILRNVLTESCPIHISLKSNY